MLNKFDRVPKFWVLQLVGWVAYASVVLIGLAPRLRDHYIVAYQAVFVFSTFLASFLIRLVCRRLWRRNTPWPSAMFQSVVASGLLALPCALAGQVAELMIRGEPLRWRNMQTGFTGIPHATFLLASWSGLYFSIKHYQALQTERERVLEAESLARQARLQALRYQLNPHFLFNTLNSISVFISEGDSSAANGMLTQLARLLRSTLDEDISQEIPLRREIAITQEYLAIEKTRLGSRLELMFSISPETIDVLVPVLLLQPLVENAIRHGIGRRPEGGTLKIETYIVRERLHINVSDDGVGATEIDHKEERPRGGIGVANTIERLRVLYGKNHGLAVTWPPDGGCRIELEFPAVLASSRNV
jgi:hypothetical protein